MLQIPSLIPCVGLMLGAGFARRYGSDKRKARLRDGSPLLAGSMRVAEQVLEEVWLVLRLDDDPVALGLAGHAPVVRCDDAALGMGCSLACGVRALERTSRADALMILLGDMPWIRPGTLALLLEFAGTERIVVPVHAGRRGHPVIFGRSFWPDLMALGGDQGARAVLRRYPQALTEIVVEDVGVLLDVDTPEALTAGSGPR